MESVCFKLLKFLTQTLLVTCSPFFHLDYRQSTVARVQKSAWPPSPSVLLLWIIERLSIESLLCTAPVNEFWSGKFCRIFKERSILFRLLKIRCVCLIFPFFGGLWPINILTGFHLPSLLVPILFQPFRLFLRAWLPPVIFFLSVFST